MRGARSSGATLTTPGRGVLGSASAGVTGAMTESRGRCSKRKAVGSASARVETMVQPGRRRSLGEQQSCMLKYTSSVCRAC